MNRLFQHYKGVVKELSGKSISSFLSIEDAINGDVYILWLENETSGLWYRIFIDGWYCGVDEYPESNIENDFDDDVNVVNHFSKLKSKIIESAIVKDSDGENRHIVLTIKFSDQSVELICEVENGGSKLVFIA